MFWVSEYLGNLRYTLSFFHGICRKKECIIRMVRLRHLDSLIYVFAGCSMESQRLEASSSNREYSYQTVQMCRLIWLMAVCTYDCRFCLDPPYISHNTTKPTKWPVHPLESHISLGIHPVWASSPCICLKPPIKHTESVRSDWTDAQADLSLCWMHRSFCWFCRVGAPIMSTRPTYHTLEDVDWSFWLHQGVTSHDSCAKKMSTKTWHQTLSTCAASWLNATKWHVCPAKTQISLDIRPIWSVFAVRMKKAWVLSYPMSTQRRLWSDWADAQADLSLRWVHSHFVGFVMRQLNFFRLLVTYIMDEEHTYHIVQRRCCTSS